MWAEPKRRLTAEEYLELERSSAVKHEFLAGELFKMAGAAWAHSQIVLGVATALGAALRGGSCSVAVSDLRVHVPATGLYTYPDVVVVCGERKFADAHVDTLLNPTVLIEVLSPSTASYDRGEKFAHYRTLPSLREYLVLAQDRVHAEHSIRQQAGWLLREADDPAAVLELPTLGCRLILGELYAAALSS